MEYISFNYNQKIEINELADYIGVNRSYLTSSFKKAIGCSPQEYLVNLRMEKARSLLKNTDMQINAIANSVGYVDQLAFSKIFKQHYGMSPRAYREEEEELVIKNKKGDYEGAPL
ncbi:helix-turn-helix transcriptional regulator [Blautia sp. RD014234]|nr:helix-turn-helix transcriptional regulator [Blautia parvula]